MNRIIVAWRRYLRRYRGLCCTIAAFIALFSTVEAAVLDSKKWALLALLAAVALWLYLCDPLGVFRTGDSDSDPDDSNSETGMFV